MPFWLTNVYNKIQPYKDLLIILGAICTILTFILAFIFSSKVRGKILKVICIFFNFLKKLLWSPFVSIIRNIKTIPMLHSALEDLYETVTEIKKTVSDPHHFSSVPPDQAFIGHGLLWHYTDKAKSKVLETPVCLYCYEIGQVFVHMRDITPLTEREYMRTFRCPHCKEQVDILLSDYREDMQESPF